MTRLASRYVGLWLLVLVVAQGCENASIFAPAGSIIILTAADPVIPLGGQTTLRVVATERSQTPVPRDTVVTFQTTLGRVDPSEGLTVDGVATTTLFAEQTAGTAMGQSLLRRSDIRDRVRPHRICDAARAVDQHQSPTL